MTQTGRRARVVHAIPGRLRIRFDESGPAPTSDGLAAVRVAPGILAIEAKPAARSIVVQYDPEQTTQALVLVELEQAGILVAALDEAMLSDPPADVATRLGSPSPAHGRGGRGVRAPATAGERSAWMEMLIGPPPKLDRRFAESLALSAVSLLAARRVGLAFGGGTTLPAYFAIWFALRRLTGLGRRR